MKSNAIVAHETGGPEVLKWEQIDVASPTRGEALIRHTDIGMNFIDVYFRSGLYPSPNMPFCPGMEGAARVKIDDRRLIVIWTKPMMDWARVALWRWWPV